MITILIPTLNRSEFLLRQLEFLYLKKYKGRIFIGDSSNNFHKENLLNGIKKFDNKLNIKYFYYPSLSDACVMKKLSLKIDTKYSVMIGDDDLLIPESLYECIEFLENNNNYIAAHGKSIGVKLLGDKPYGKIIELFNYSQPILENDNALKRVCDLLSNYSTPLFCVHRSEVWQKIYSTINNYKDKRFHRELVPSLLAPVYGKYKEIDNLFMIRQFHSSQYLLSNINNWILEEHFFNDFDLLKDELYERTKKIENNLSKNLVRTKINKAIQVYLKKSMPSNNRYFFKKFLLKYFKKYENSFRLLRFLTTSFNYDKNLYSKIFNDSKYRDIVSFLEGKI